jgi:hypothetical protein
MRFWCSAPCTALRMRPCSASAAASSDCGPARQWRVGNRGISQTAWTEAAIHGSGQLLPAASSSAPWPRLGLLKHTHHHACAWRPGGMQSRQQQPEHGHYAAPTRASLSLALIWGASSALDALRASMAAKWSTWAPGAACTGKALKLTQTRWSGQARASKQHAIQVGACCWCLGSRVGESRASRAQVLAGHPGCCLRSRRLNRHKQDLCTHLGLAALHCTLLLHELGARVAARRGRARLALVAARWGAAALRSGHAVLRRVGAVWGTRDLSSLRPGAYCEVMAMRACPGKGMGGAGAVWQWRERRARGRQTQTLASTCFSRDASTCLILAAASLLSPVINDTNDCRVLQAC